MGYVYYNQNNYGNVPYPSPTAPNATIKSGGCGPTCAAMIVSNLTSKTVDPKAMASFAIKIGARVSGGTDMNKLAKGLVGQYGLTYATTNDENTLIQHLKSGGMAIANVGGDRPGYKGVFSDSGHYVVVAGIAQDGRIIVLDPGYYAGKFNKTGRVGKVTVKGNECHCAITVLVQDTSNRNPGYYLFARKEVKKEGVAVADIPAWKFQVIKEAEEVGLIMPNTHRPEEPADKAFVLAIALNMLKIIKKLIGGK